MTSVCPCGKNKFWLMALVIVIMVLLILLIIGSSVIISALDSGEGHTYLAIANELKSQIPASMVGFMRTFYIILLTICCLLFVVCVLPIAAEAKDSPVLMRIWYIVLIILLIFFGICSISLFFMPNSSGNWATIGCMLGVTGLTLVVTKFRYDEMVIERQERCGCGAGAAVKPAPPPAAEKAEA